jgi:DNA invertase Pin-like site-specific DNA recombinase
VSTQEQADSGAGLAAQRAAIEAEASRRGWTDLEWVTDAGVSAKSLRRPGMAYALAKLQGGEASILCAAKMDRVSRSLIDWATVMQQAQREGWALVALDSPADLTTPQGEAMAGMQAVWAQLERRLISERTKAALAAKRAAGVRLGRPPVIGDDVAKLAADLSAEGLSLRKIGARLTDAGHLPPSGGQWYPTTVRGLLARR